MLEVAYSCKSFVTLNKGIDLGCHDQFNTDKQHKIITLQNVTGYTKSAVSLNIFICKQTQISIDSTDICTYKQNRQLYNKN